MFERFTERARQVVELAQEEARILKHSHIGTEHILLGVVREGDHLAAWVLASLDITVERVRAQVVRIVGSGEEVTAGQIPFTPHAKKVLELALREALSLGHNFIGAEHILLGLVRENEGLGARILLDFDADSVKIRNEVISMLWGPSARRGIRGEAARVKRSGAKAGPSQQRSMSQRMEALELANRVRLARAQLKRALAGGDIDLADLFLDPPEEVRTAKVFDLLAAVPRSYRVRAARAFADLRVSPNETVEGLSDRQRRALVEILRDSPQGGQPLQRPPE